MFLVCLIWLILASVAQAQVGVRDTSVTVRPGDSLLGIAYRLLPYSAQYTALDLVGEIQRHNGLQSDAIRPGQRLTISLSYGDLLDQLVLRGPDFVARGIYVKAQLAGSSRILALADELVAVGGNTIVFDVKDRYGNLGYASAVPMALAIGAGDEAPIARPAKLIDALHRRQIHVVARLTCFYDDRLARQRPDLVPLSRLGSTPWSESGKSHWVDPSLPQVRGYLLALVREVAALGVDEIQLDYVRFPTEGNLAAAVFAFDPEIVPKDRIITDFVAAVDRLLDSTGVMLSADIFGVAAWGREADRLTLGQYLPELLPHLDVVSPMLYPSHFEDGFERISRPVDYPYYFLLQGCQRLEKLAAVHQVPIRPWIQAFNYRVARFDPLYITEQLQGAEDGGARGWLLWNSSGQYTVGLQAIARFESGTAASVPVQERFPEPLGMGLPRPVVD
ncbi:MAG: putative glycoside hydrolase [Candidatus Latescibacterota bacterium]|nr:putative glycoside hydrolase [Candidatus Latescibacterota bacterium]